MKNLFIRFYILTYFLLYIPSASAQDFISGFEDIPLMAGLSQIEDENIVFDHEESSYREAVLESSPSVNYQNIIEFYSTTLPHFGWKFLKFEKGINIFVRENAHLEIRKINSKPLKISICLKNKS